MSNNKRPNPKYHAGDKVIVTDKRDGDYGCVLEVLGMSPSTIVHRSHGQWRYKLSNLIYYSECDLEAAESFTG